MSNVDIRCLALGAPSAAFEARILYHNATGKQADYDNSQRTHQSEHLLMNWGAVTASNEKSSKRTRQEQFLLLPNYAPRKERSLWHGNCLPNSTEAYYSVIALAIA